MSKAYALPVDPTPAALQRYVGTALLLRDELPWGFDTVTEVSVDASPEASPEASVVKAVLVVATRYVANPPVVRVTHRLECWMDVETPQPGSSDSTDSYLSLRRMYIESVGAIDGRIGVIDLTRNNYRIGRDTEEIPDFPTEWWKRMQTKAGLLMFACLDFPRLIRPEP